VEIAEKLGAIIVQGLPHNGYIDLLDYQGFSCVHQGWILRMDADERLTPQLAAALKSIMGDNSISAVAYARLNYMFGEFVKHGGWFKADTVGFFRVDSWDRDWDSSLHSQVPIQGYIYKLEPTTGYMIHLDYLNIRTFIYRSLFNYAYNEALALQKKGARFRTYNLFFRPSRRFLGRFLIRKGFKDGRRGLILALLLALYDTVIQMYLWDLSKKSESSESGVSWN
jgi:hypothetical protein